MDAVEFLTQQHLELRSLLDQFLSASGRAGKSRLRLCTRIGDLVAAHTRIEDAILHRATKRGRTQKLLDTGREAHVAMRRIAADLAALEVVDERVEKMVAELTELKASHSAEEENELFPVARELLAPAWLEELAGRMERMSNDLMSEARSARLVRASPAMSRALRRFATPRSGGPDRSGSAR